MITPNSLVVYKNRPALVTEIGDKIEICLPGGETLRVREKDIETIHPGPCGPEVLESGELTGDVRGAWELLEGSSLPLRELAELVYGEDTAKTAWAAYGLLQDGLYFSGTPQAISARKGGEVEAEERKRQGKQREIREREAFLERLRAAGALDLPGDSRFLQDVEALACGRTDKCRTLKDLGRPETPPEAHRLLLEKGVWTPMVNPHLARFGALVGSAKTPLPPPPAEDRLDLTGLAAFAIDNPWSDDPDDALSLEGDAGCTLWVHVADPAAALLPGSPPDLEARGRGTTLYLPEGSSRMITGEALPVYALGVSPVSPALSFKISLDAGGNITGTDIIPSLVRVTRLTYEAADSLIGEGAALAAFFALADRNHTRRSGAGAVSIEIPEVHIRVSDGKVSIEPIKPWRSADLVRECMLLAGEGAARWALQRRLPFPYAGQEPGDLPASPLPGLAGAYQLRRCMRPRTLSVKPAAHWSLGLDGYTQVTSPLRRYTDLLAHQQIRAFLQGEKPGALPPLGEEELLLRLAAADAAAQGNIHAERASRTHWTMVYLSDKRDSSWEGVILEKRGSRALVLIPALGLETQIPLRGGEPNDVISLTLKSVRIPEGEANFIKIGE
jgi:exoribonuclease-2